MRNVILAAVSAVAILGSTPEAHAVAAAKEFPLLLNGHKLIFTQYDYEGHTFWHAPYGGYWVVAYSDKIGSAPVWKTETIDGKKMYLYGVSYEPAHAKYGLWHIPFARWTAYKHFVAPHMMDAVLDQAVEAPYNVKETKVK